MAEEFTAKFTLDISDLKKAISDAGKAIRQANADFNAQTSGMDNWSKNADGLSAKLAQLRSVLVNQNTVLDAYKEQLSRTQNAEKENADRVEYFKAKLEELAKQGLKPADDEYKKYADNLKKAKKEQDNNKKSIEDLNIKVKQQEAAVHKTEKSIRDYEAAEKKLEAENKSLTKTIKDQGKELDDLKKEYAETVAAEGKNSESAQMLALRIDKLSSELKENKDTMKDAEKAADDLDRSLDDTADQTSKTSDGFTVMKGVAADLASTLVRKLAEGLKKVATEAINTGITFEDTMSNNKALFRATEDEMELLTATARTAGTDLGFTAKETGDALGYMALAGWNAAKSAENLPGVLRLAKAANMELAEASDMVTDYMSAFSRSELEAAEFADILAYAQSNSNTTARQLGEAYSNSAANLNAAGQEVETVTALLAAMANQGEKGSGAGTQLAAIMRDLTSKMEDGHITIGKTNVAIMDAEGNYRKLTDILRDVQKATDGLGDAERASALAETFTARSIAGVNLLLNEGVDSIEAFEQELRNADGSAEAMANTMNDNVGGSLAILKANIQDKMIGMFEAAKEPIQEALGSISKGLDKIDWSNVGEWIGKITKKAAELLGYVIKNSDKVIKFLKTAATILVGIFAVNKVSKFIDSIKTLWSVMAANPIAAIITLTVALTAAVFAAQKAYSNYLDTMYGLNDEERELVDSIRDERKALDEATEARKQANSTIEAEYGQSKSLLQELKQITDENGHIKEGYEERAGVITGLLADSLGIEIDIVDGQIQKYEELMATIDDVIEKKRTEALMEAAKQDYTTAIANQAQAYQRYTDALAATSDKYDKLVLAEAALADLEREKNEVIGGDMTQMAGLQEAYNRQSEIVNTLKSAYEEEAAALQDAESTYFDYVSTIQNYEGVLGAQATGDAEAVSQALDKLSNDFKTAETGTREMLEQQVDTFRSQYESMKRAVDTGMPGVTQSQVDSMAKMVTAAETELKKLGVQSKKQGDEAAGQFINAIDRATDKARSSAEKVAKNAESGLRAFNTSAVGGDFSYGFINMLRSSKVLTDAYIAGAAVGGEAVKGMKHELNSNSPSKVTEAVGEDFDRGFIMGIENLAHMAAEAAEDMGAGSVRALQQNPAQAAYGLMSGAMDSAYGAGGSAGGVTHNSTSFTQIINAPKSPSRIELYRQTRNLLALSNGGA